LWFAIERPGKRLLDENGISVAPIWSWASIEIVIALDLLSDTALVKIAEKEILVEDLVVNTSSNNEGSKLTMTGPLLPIQAPLFDRMPTWSIALE
jgi:hypothetical protein